MAEIGFELVTDEDVDIFILVNEDAEVNLYWL